MEISSTSTGKLPQVSTLKTLCKTLALLDAILSQEWEYRYYSYNNNWGEQEEFFQMRNGEGDEMQVIFTETAAVINGFAHEYYDYEAKLPSKLSLTTNLPPQLATFIFEEPIASIGTTYCLWTNEKQLWTVGKIEHKEDGSVDQLYIFDNNPQTYITWANEYYFDDQPIKLTPEAITTIHRLYQGEEITKEMVLTLNNALDDWELLKEDIAIIGYKSAL